MEEVDKDGALVLIMAHPAGANPSGVPQFRPIAFDAARHRYALEGDGGVGTGQVSMYRYRLKPEALPAKKVAYLGVEMMTADGERIIALEAAKRARKEGVEVLPFAEVGKIYDFTLTSIDGKKVHTKDLRGKVVVIDCWATWCSPCMALLPELKELYAKHHKDGLEVIGISFDQVAGKAESACKKLGLTWTQVLAPSDEKTRQLWTEASGISALPRVLILDKDGILRHDGPVDLTEAIGTLLKARPNNPREQSKP
jgi:peroxiredoxin